MLLALEKLNNTPYKMPMLRKFILSNFCVGLLRGLLYRLDRVRFGYPKWHCSPINHKPYAISIVETIERMIKAKIVRNGYIVEVGCGRGDIIGNLQYDKKIGLDIDATIIRAASFYHPDMEFLVGGIGDIPVPNIDVLRLVNILAGFSPETVHGWIEPILGKPNIIVIDKVEGYKYVHDGTYLFDSQYKMFLKSEKFKASHESARYIEYWIKHDI